MLIAAACLIACAEPGAATFRVSFPERVRTEPATGRLVVYLIGPESRLPPGTPPSSGPFWDDPQPLYGIDVAGLRPGEVAVVDAGADSYPVPLNELPPGEYAAQAVLDLSRISTNWIFEPGNLSSATVRFVVPEAGPAAAVALELTNVVPERQFPNQPAVELFEARSEILSDFHGRDIVLRAAVARPLDEEPGRPYAAVYDIPGFGFDHALAYAFAAAARRGPGDAPAAALARRACWITLDPHGPYGHSMFVDSANNGPYARALVEEFLPAIELKYDLISEAPARLLRGHGPGGFAAVWLALTRPETFGGAWAIAPDPVDFSAFAGADLAHPEPGIPPLRGGAAPEGRGTRRVDTDSTRPVGGVGVFALSTRERLAIEEVLGPHNTSSQRWHAWMAALGPRDPATGGPADLFDPESGGPRPEIAEHFRRSDPSRLLDDHEGDIGLILQQRVRIIVGSEDDWMLDVPADRLKSRLDGLHFFHYPEGRNGYVRIVPGADHRTILTTPEAGAMMVEMAEAIDRAGG